MAPFRILSRAATVVAVAVVAGADEEDAAQVHEGALLVAFAQGRP